MAFFIVFDEEKRMLRYYLFIKEQFLILCKVHCQDFSGGCEEGWGTENYKKSIIMSLMNEFN